VTITGLIFIKLMLPWWLFVKISHMEFHENSTHSHAPSPHKTFLFCFIKTSKISISFISGIDAMTYNSTQTIVKQTRRRPKPIWTKPEHIQKNFHIVNRSIITHMNSATVCDVLCYSRRLWFVWWFVYVYIIWLLSVY
jgi:hypothetical protein